MENFIEPIADDLLRFVVGFNELKKNSRNPKAIQEFWKIGCDCYGKSNIIIFANGIGQFDIIKEYV